MQTFAALFIFTLCYGLLFLSLFPVKSQNRVDDLSYDHKKAVYKKYDLTWPYFISFLGGYILASFMVYLIQDYI